MGTRGASAVFADRVNTPDETYTTYRVTLEVRDKLIGGVPKDPDTIAKWIQARMEVQDRALIELVEEASADMLATYMERNGELARKLMDAYGKLRTDPCCTAGPTTACSVSGPAVTG